MPWSEHWPIVERSEDLRGSSGDAVNARAVAALVGAALADRGFTLGPAVVLESGEVEGARVEGYGRYVTVALGVGDGELFGTITFARGEGDDAGYVEFNSDDVRGPWEPMYELFAELATAAGAVQEPAIVTELDPGELREEVRSIIDACVSDAMLAEGLEPEEAAILEATDGHPLDAFELDVELRAESVVVRLTGAGDHVEVVVRGLAAGLSARGRTAIGESLRADLAERVDYHRWLRHQRVSPPADPARAGALYLERRASGKLLAAEPLADLAALRAALVSHDVDVIRYFSSGAPFWKASYQRGHELDDAIGSLDDLHADRTWQWEVVAEVAEVAEVEKPEPEPEPAGGAG
jgi:hypothetical protein